MYFATCVSNEIGCWLDDKGSVPGRAMEFYLSQRVYFDPHGHLSSYPIDAGSSLPQLQLTHSECYVFLHSPMSWNVA
jgi:hypothetical protein